MSDKITRREFIKKSAIGIVVGGTVLSSLDISALARNSKRGNYLKMGDEVVINLKDTKNSDLLKVGGGVFLDDEDMLVRVSQTKFVALSLICKHKGCTVELTGGKFVCPCHGSEYAIDGKVTEGPAKKNLDTYDVVYDPEKETVTVNMGKKIQSDQTPKDSEAPKTDK
jgi:cytochrome b6-f complex iron-sulfur subunit